MSEGVGVVDTGQAGSAAAGATGSSDAATGSAAVSTGSGHPAPSPKWEDDPRAKGMFADLQRERKARQDFERRLAESDARGTERDRQIAALTNSRIPSKEEADADQIKQRFSELFPHLGELTAEDIEALRELKDQRGQLQQAIVDQYANHSRRILSEVHKKIGAELGDLTPRQRARINAAYLQEAEANPEFLERHNNGDATLVDEFVKAYLEDTAEPIRRKLTAAEVSRQRAVPNGGRREIRNAQDKPIDVTDDKAVMDLIMESRRGQFKR